MDASHAAYPACRTPLSCPIQWTANTPANQPHAHVQLPKAIPRMRMPGCTHQPTDNPHACTCPQEMAGELKANNGNGNSNAARAAGFDSSARAPAAAATIPGDAVPVFDMAVASLLARTAELKEQVRAGRRSLPAIIDDAAKQFIAPLRAVKFAAASNGNTTAYNAADKAVTRMEVKVRTLKTSAGASRGNPETAIDELMALMRVSGCGWVCVGFTWNVLGERRRAQQARMHG